MAADYRILFKHIKLISCLGIVLIVSSCRNKDTEVAEHISTIRLLPDQAETLKISDYFDHVTALWLKDCIYNDIDDFTEISSGYLARVDYPHYRFLLFNQEGHYLHPIAKNGRGAGEYLSFKGNLQISKDSMLQIIDNGNFKFLEYTLGGDAAHEKKLNYDKYTYHNLSFNHPQTIIYDSLLLLYPSDGNLINNKSLYEEIEKALKGTYLLQLYSLSSQQIVQSYFRMDDIADLQLNNQFYKFKDSLYFYFDKDQIIYQIGPDGKKAKYRIDKGGYDDLQTKEKYTEARLHGIVDTKRIMMQSCNETERYIMGEYVFKNRFYLFIYDKVKDETKNYKAIDNDLLGVVSAPKQKKTLFDFQTGFKFKEDYVWTTVDRNFLGILKESKSNMTPEEWKKFENSHPDFAQIYKEFEKMGEALEEETPIVLIRYYFK